MSDTTIQKSEYEEHDLIRALVSTPPVNIVAVEPEQMSDEKGAFFKPEESCIYVRKGISAQEIFQNLVPELVFAGYADGNPHYDKNEDAFHVSCTSYMLCKNMEWIPVDIIFYMHQSFLKNGDSGSESGTFQSQRCSECNFFKNGKGTRSESECNLPTVRD